jgi:aspartate/methionine/tyrosine aminotransferase
MSEADHLNDVLRREHPAAFRMLSPLGQRACFPHGIPWQASEARGSRIDATIGQLTDGAGNPLPVPSLGHAVDGLDRGMVFLYSPLEGPLQVRKLWSERERRLAGNPRVPVSVPVVSHGLTHSLSIVSDLFADPDTDVLVPSPGWENYDLVFQFHAGARIVRYDLFDEAGQFSTAQLERALSQIRKKGIVILNLPSNPTGWMPDSRQAAQIVEVIAAHKGPLLAVTDDAYQGFCYEPGLHPRSLFWDLAERADPERMLCLKADGATKELVFFSSRVGFVSHTATGAAEAPMLSKIKTVLRATVGPASGPALAMVQKALLDPGLDAAIGERMALMDGRYRVLKDILHRLDPARFRVRPFNSSFFVLIDLLGETKAEAIRRQLLSEHSIGVIAFPSTNALRLAYCSLDAKQFPELVDAVAMVASGRGTR